jgi:hypothetical protein
MEAVTDNDRAAAPGPAARMVQAAADAINRTAGNTWTPARGLPDHERDFLEALYDAARCAGSGLHALGDERVLKLGYSAAWDLADGLVPVSIVMKLRRAELGQRLRPVTPVAAQVVGLAELHLLGHHEQHGRPRP